jgi:hypothetical protein
MNEERKKCSLVLLAMAAVAAEKGLKKTALSIVAVSASCLNEEEENLMFEAIHRHVTDRNKEAGPEKSQAGDWLKAYQERGGREGKA